MLTILCICIWKVLYRNLFFCAQFCVKLDETGGIFSVILAQKWNWLWFHDFKGLKLWNLLFIQKQPKNSPVTTKISEEIKTRLVISVKNFHSKNETGKTVKKEAKSRNFSKTPSRIGHCNRKLNDEKNLYGKIFERFYRKCVIQR